MKREEQEYDDNIVILNITASRSVCCFELYCRCCLSCNYHAICPSSGDLMTLMQTLLDCLIVSSVHSP